MLILARKLEEEIYLGNDISIKVVEINKGVVKLGIEAPKDMQILRGELKKELEKTNIEANHNTNTKEIKDLRKLLKKWK